MTFSRFQKGCAKYPALPRIVFFDVGQTSRIGRMRRFAILLSVLAAGCASSTQVSVGAGSASGTYLGLDIQSGSAVGAVIAIGALGAMYGSGDGGAKPPALMEGRTVHEQDCTRPLEDPSANLRCR
jgi:hypothetical protein